MVLRRNCGTVLGTRGGEFKSAACKESFRFSLFVFFLYLLFFSDTLIIFLHMYIERIEDNLVSSTGLIM